MPLEGGTYRIDKNRVASPEELVDLGIEQAAVEQMLRLLKTITDDDFGCSGNCEGLYGHRNPVLKQAREALVELQRVVDDDVARAIASLRR